MNMRLKLFFCSALMGFAVLFPNSLFAGPFQTDTDKVVAGNSQFALDLYARLRTNDGNVFFSPYSISTALAMTYAGARGETARQMARTLRFDLPAHELHPAFAALATNLEAIQDQGHVQLAIANSLWPQIGYKFRPDFLRLCGEDYGAAVLPVDFKHHTEAARNEINGWVAVRTDRKIDELIRPGVLDKSSRLVLVDAIYFKGNWERKFNYLLTRDQPFHVSAAETVNAPLMEQTADFGYAEFPGLQVLDMPYMGDEISMIVLLPRKVDGLGTLEEQLTADNFKTWIASLPTQKVHVFFPSFTMTSGLSLADTLADMGMPDAFNKRADFSGMDGSRNLYISHVIHQAYVKVDEEGTEAAAATAVVVAFGGASLVHAPPIPVFRADHPFLFLIRDNQTGSILFLGRVTNPIP